MRPASTRSPKSLSSCTGADGEAGFMLLAVVVACALVLIALAVAAPVVANQLRRDKEEESVHRMQEYVRAIQLFYRKNRSYPGSIKALENTNNVRYLRKQWVDPLTGEANWRIIHLGEQKTTVKTFFGKELAGLPGGGAAGGLGSAAGMQSPGQSTVMGAGLSAGFNGATIGQQGPGGAAAGGATTPAGGTGAAGATASTGAQGSTGATGGSGVGMFGDSAGGGGAIIGVGTARTGPSILTPNQQATYETWEFWYDPRIEFRKRNVSILGGGVSSQSATGLGSGLGSTGSTGTTGTTPGNTGTTPVGSSPSRP